MAAEFRAPDPVRAHLNTAWLDRPLPAAQPRTTPSDHRRPPVRRKRAVGATALALLAPAVALAALAGFGTVGNGVSQGLGSIQGAVGLTGSAETGDLTVAERREKDFSREPEPKPRPTAASAPARRAPAVRTPKPKPTGPGVIPVNRPAPAVPAAPTTSEDEFEDDDHGEGGSSGSGSGSGGSGSSGP